MNDAENQLIKINEKIDKLNNSFNFLQDLILKLTDELDFIKKSNIKEKFFSKLSLAARKQMIYFLKNKFSKCKASDLCIKLLESGTYKILRVYNQEGPSEAIELINSYCSKIESFKTECDEDCLNNSMQIYLTLKDLITTSIEKIKYTEELFALKKDSIFEDGSEDEINNIISPLSNVIRLKILKNLRKGGKTYSQLEKQMGIKAGHLLFHMEKLINAGYVMQKKRNYIITISGLKILKYLYGLKEELF
ncbi:MAG: winged helix-turn-helix domain-containing protein [Promethearchaeota archaeon]